MGGFLNEILKNASIRYFAVIVEGYLKEFDNNLINDKMNRPLEGLKSFKILDLDLLLNYFLSLLKKDLSNEYFVK